MSVTPILLTCICVWYVSEKYVSAALVPETPEERSSPIAMTNSSPITTGRDRNVLIFFIVILPLF